MLLKLDIHDRSTPRKWRGGTPHHSIFQPIRLGRSFTVVPSKPQSQPLLHLLLPPPGTREPLPAPISSPSPTYLRRSHFSIYDPAVSMEQLVIQIGWKYK
ncbi:hypothetical protein AVEN_248381-1 [Araneus ventricosus]|uniref:Uncharacterized protein n=1 Tax=Araneus ventricosus TaxID=182803 RepID=A0A4Y2LLS6_ARAVE|nr:hypothetical protein AVEN_248381-1 [Araneus ventricosus]